ncbi:endonuclease/exonuclease/phosphatase family protein [Frigidibacter sp. RF13]|uniref:endonuclease/exonuclease/phosphatase family protein n=1 Tax=Frigidibacter sp. RF13 TaxID=2997340 RepID=UPI002270BAB7|nr:endonuclease/exonuclease/phosphatase family protein [Frigidibacter sp. RF13]MCY1128153.1 endonuclease/exonuclease/phosphatase family protein [Frigidibacter sp. RF13]
MILAAPAAAETLRVATWDPDLSRDGPGLVARDLAAGKDAQIRAALAVIAAADADILLLTDLDWDADLVALRALQTSLEAAGHPYPYSFAFRPNAGEPTGFDLDGDGSVSGPRDAQGFGSFRGQGGMAILSRLAIDDDGTRDLSPFLWRDLPGNRMAEAGLPESAEDVLRLSAHGMWDVPVALPNGNALHLLAWHAGPPVFAPEAMNRARNHDEATFWPLYLDGKLPWAPPEGPFVLLGNANTDPEDGAGDRTAIRALLSDPRLIDPRPASLGGATAALPDKAGDPALDTADWAANPNVGDNLRVDYVLPSADLVLTGSGVIWPAPDDPFAATVAAASPHRLVWVDIDLP